MHSLMTYYPTKSNEVCGICLDPLSNGKSIVAHNEQSTKKLIHFLHKECIRKWLEVAPSKICPFCLAPVNFDSLIPLKEKLIKKLNLVARKGLMCAITGATMAVIGTQIHAIEKVENLKQISLVLITGSAIGGIGTAAIIGKIKGIGAIHGALSGVKDSVILIMGALILNAAAVIPFNQDIIAKNLGLIIGLGIIVHVIDTRFDQIILKKIR